MQVVPSADFQSVPCFHYDQQKNEEVDDSTLEMITGMAVQPEPCKVPATYDHSTKIVALLVDVRQLFTQNRGLALARDAAARISREQSSMPGYEGLFEHARRLYCCESIVFVSVYTEHKNQFLATVPLHLGTDGVVRALLPWNGYCYEEGMNALTTAQVCVCCLKTHARYLNASTCTGAPVGDFDTKTYDGAMRACLCMLSVFGSVDRRQLLLNSSKQLLAVFDGPLQRKCSDDTAHADVLTYSSLALLGLLPIGIVHRAMTQPAMHAQLAQVLMRDVCALFAGKCVLTANDAELFSCLLVWNLHRLQAGVQTYRREQGEDQRRMLALRSRAQMYMVGDCEDLASFLLQLVGTIFRVPQLRRQLPPHVRLGPAEQNMLLPARGFFHTKAHGVFHNEVHAFPVQLELGGAGCMLRVIEATRPVLCFETTDDRDRAQEALRALPGGDGIQYTLASQQRDCYTVWFLGECMVFVLSHGGGSRAVLEHMAKPRTPYAGPLRLAGHGSPPQREAARIHALARARTCARTQTLVLIPEHVFFYAYAELAQYAPRAVGAPLDCKVAKLAPSIARHIELQQSFADLLQALFSESHEAHELFAKNLECKLGQCPEPLGPLVCGPRSALQRQRVLQNGCPGADMRPRNPGPPPGPGIADVQLQAGVYAPPGPGLAYTLCAFAGTPPGSPVAGAQLQAGVYAQAGPDIAYAPCSLARSACKFPPLAHPVREALLKLHAHLWSVQCSLFHYLHYARDIERPSELCSCVVAHARDIHMHRPLFVGWYGKFLCPLFEYFARVCSEEEIDATADECACVRLDVFCMQVSAFLQCVQALLARAGLKHK